MIEAEQRFSQRLILNGRGRTAREMVLGVRSMPLSDWWPLLEMPNRNSKSIDAGSEPEVVAYF
jgi:hypothetical protein